jgi:hypothetical protein
MPLSDKERAEMPASLVAEIDAEDAKEAKFAQSIGTRQYVNDDEIEIRSGKLSMNSTGANNCLLCTIAGLAGKTAITVRDEILDKSGLHSQIYFGSMQNILQKYTSSPQTFPFEIINKAPIFKVRDTDKFPRPSLYDEMILIGGDNEIEKAIAAQALLIDWYFRDSYDVYYFGSLQSRGKLNITQIIELMNQQRSKVSFACYLGGGHWEVARNVPTRELLSLFRHSPDKKTLTFTDYQTDNAEYIKYRNYHGKFPRTGNDPLNPLEDTPIPDERMIMSSLAIALFPKSLKNQIHRLAGLRTTLSV